MSPAIHDRGTTSDPQLRLELLGGLQINIVGSSGDRAVSAKASALLAYLAVTGRPHSREALAGLLWGESDDADARTSLRAVLSQLRKLAGAHIIIERDRVAFDQTSRYWLDIEAFETGLRDPTRGSSDRSTAALALYQGEFLAGFSVRGAPAFDEWVTIQRERLRRIAVDALSALADRQLLLGDDSVALDSLRRLLSLDPWREDALRQMMLLLNRQGQRATALAQYETCRQILANELGVEPEDETQALAERIRSGALPTSAAASTRRLTLPVHPTPILGRDDEIDQLAACLTARNDRLVTLVGPGGVGKTRLALAAATRVSPDFSRGACFVNLAPITSTNHVASSIARALGLRETTGPTSDEWLIDALRELDILLLLDNFEQVLAATPLIAAILAACPSISMLATSRSPLRVRGERQLVVQPLPLPKLESGQAPTELQANPAVALFAQRATATQASFALTDRNAGAVAAICVRLDGLPLALELAAARIDSLPPHALLERLNQRLALLTTGASDLPDRQRTLRDTITWSYNLLTPVEQRLFRCLSVFRGGATLDAIEAVCRQDDDSSDFAILNSLTSLINMSLVQPITTSSADDGSPTPRFTMLETIREYARERLLSSDDHVDSYARHAAHFLALVEHAGPRLTGPDQTAWLERLEADHGNVRAVLSRGLTSATSVDISARLAGALWTFWEIRGYVDEGRRWLAQAIEAAERSATLREDLTWQANIRRGSGILAQRQGDYPMALDHLSRGLALVQELGDERGVAATLIGLARVAQDQGNYVLARTHYEAALTISRDVMDERCEADALAGLGTVAYWLAEYDQARERLNGSLDTSRTLGNTRGIAATLQRLSYVMRHQGDFAGARTTARESLALQRELGDQSGVAYSLNTLGNVARDCGDHASAVQLLNECLEIQRQIGDRQGAAYTLHQLGIVARATGDLPTATRLSHDSLTIFRALQHTRGIAYALASCAAAAREHGDHPAARRFLTESLTIQRGLGDHRGLANVLEEIAALMLAVGAPDDAARVLGLSAALREDAGAMFSDTRTGSDDATVTTVRARLGHNRFVRRWNEGRTMSVEQIVEYVSNAPLSNKVVSTPHG